MCVFFFIVALLFFFSFLVVRHKKTKLGNVAKEIFFLYNWSFKDYSGNLVLNKFQATHRSSSIQKWY